jgi:hypothetical protein
MATVSPPQRPEFGTAQRMRPGHAMLQPVDVQVPGLQVDLISPEGDQFPDAEAVAVGQQDQRRVPVPVAADPSRPP